MHRFIFSDLRASTISHRFFTWNLYHKRGVGPTHVIHHPNIDTVVTRISERVIYYQATRAVVFHGQTTHLFRWKITVF